MKEEKPEGIIDIQDPTYCPAMEEVEAYVKNQVFQTFCTAIKENYKVKETIEFSSCSMEKGWNIKFKKSGKSLCTIYPKESFFTVLVVIGKKEKAAVEEILPGCSPEIQGIYHQTKEGNGQRWLMIPLEDKDSVYEDVLRLIGIRQAGTQSGKSAATSYN